MFTELNSCSIGHQIADWEYFVLARYLNLVNLCSQPESLRDLEWERAFLQALVDGSIDLPSKEAAQGPDGWPYLYAKISNNASEPFLRVMDWLSTRGIGLVINAHKDMPDYVFPYGMIWGYKEYGQFFEAHSNESQAGKVIFEKGEKVLAGPPTEQYLPIYVREIFKEFFKSQGVGEIKILVISKDNNHYDMVFSLDCLGNPPVSEHQGILEAIAWFLPNHYSVVLAEESGLPKFFTL